MATSTRPVPFLSPQRRLTLLTRAEAIYESPGEIEVADPRDSKAQIIPAEGGAWIRAWVWVDYPPDY